MVNKTDDEAVLCHLLSVFVDACLLTTVGGRFWVVVLENGR